MEVLRCIEAFLIIFLSLLPTLLDVGVQVYNAVSVNTIFKHNKCKAPTGYIANGQLHCDGDSSSLVCEVECQYGFVPSYGGSRSVCTHGDWSVQLQLMRCEQGVVIIVGDHAKEVEVYGANEFPFPNLPNSSIFTESSGELIASVGSTLEYVGDKVFLCGSENIYSSSPQQQLSDHCLGVRKEEEWKLHSQLMRNRSQASSIVMENILFLLSGDGDNNSTEYLSPGSHAWKEGFALDHKFSGACVENWNRTSFIVVEYTGVTRHNIEVGMENVSGVEYVHAPPKDMNISSPFDCKVFQDKGKTLLMLVQGDQRSWTLDLNRAARGWEKITSRFAQSATVHLEIYDDQVHVFGKLEVWRYNNSLSRQWLKTTNQLRSQTRKSTTVIPYSWFTQHQHFDEQIYEEDEESILEGKILFTIPFLGDVSYVGFVSIVLIQLPGICLAFHGISSAVLMFFRKIKPETEGKPETESKSKAKDFLVEILWSILFIFFPFFLVEFLSLFHILLVDVLGKVAIGKFAGMIVEKMFKNNTKNKRGTRLMYLKVTKLYFGSCLQFCFQAILYFGYTSKEDQKITQVLSMISSSIQIIKVGTDAFIFQKKFHVKGEEQEKKKDVKEKSCFIKMKTWTMDKKAFVLEKKDAFKNLDKRTYFKSKLQDSGRFLSYVPVIASGAIFHMGCLILSSLVLKEFAGIYILAVFLANLLCLIFSPISLIERGLDKLSLKSNDPATYAEDKANNDENKMKNLGKGLYMGWTNIFMTSRIVENTSYIRFCYVLGFQPIHFLINIISLIICSSINPTISTGSVSAFLTAIGLIHIALLLLIFYQNFLEKGKRKTKTDEDFRKVKLKKTKRSLSCGIFSKLRGANAGTGNKSKAKDVKPETRRNIQQNK